MRSSVYVGRQDPVYGSKLRYKSKRTLIQYTYTRQVSARARKVYFHGKFSSGYVKQRNLQNG